MAIASQAITDDYAVYNGDCVEVAATLPSESVHLSMYSPPFADLYNYSSSDQDMSNCRTYAQFLDHYEYLVTQIARLTKPGRMTVVHCMDIPQRGQTLRDFPGDIIRLHERHGFAYHARYCIWKEPLRVAIRTRSLGLMHRQIVKDSILSGNAGADYVLAFRKDGANDEPIAHPQGLPAYYAGARPIPEGLLKKFAGWTDPKTNKLSHWIWQQFASSFWDDIRINRVLPYKAAREAEDEKHVCPLQLDVVERIVTLWSNPRDIVLTPFMGIGSEVYGALRHGRRAIGIELKASYFRQALRNIENAAGSLDRPESQSAMEFDDAEDEGDLADALSS